MVSLRVSLVSPRIVNKIRENPRDTQESFPIPIHPFPKGSMVCLGVQVPPFGKGRLGGDGKVIFV